ncbi:hypothetical protein D3C71_1715500 [compost metagenome]
MGTVSEQYMDGAWNADNWANKLETEKINQNGKGSKRTDNGSRSIKGFDNSNGYSDI